MMTAAIDRVLIPLERELQERLAWFIRLRWVAGLGILGGTWLSTSVLQLPLPPAPLYGVGLGVLAYNLLFSFGWGRPEGKHLSAKRFVFLQIGLDWAALSFLVHYSGGVRSSVTLAFIFHLIIGSILLSRKACFWLASCAALLVGGLAIAEETRIWSPPGHSAYQPSPFPDYLPSLYIWALVTVLLLVTAYLATSITARLREKEQALFNSQKELERAYNGMEGLYQLGQVVNSTLEMNSVLGTIAESAAKLLGMKACFIRLFEKSGKKLYIGGSYGLSSSYINKGPVEVEKSLIDSKTLAGGVVQVLDVGSDHRFQYREEARREGLRSVLCVPVSAKSRVLGVIRVYSDEPHYFSEQEQNLLKNLANLGAVAIENARSYADLMTLNEERLWFARTTHHQLRSPLAAIQATLDALPYAGNLTQKQEELIGRGRRRIQDSFDIIRDLLDLAAAQRPLDLQQAEPVSLKDTLHKALETATERARDKGVHLTVELPDQDVFVKAVSSDIDRIYSNLLENGIKYTPSGGQVRFSLSILNDTGCIEVVDTGIGIEATEINRIFEGFYRTKEAKATGEIGTGLGLSIVKKLVDRWGWTLEVKSQANKGSSFSISFPLFLANPQAPAGGE